MKKLFLLGILGILFLTSCDSNHTEETPPSDTNVEEVEQPKEETKEPNNVQEDKKQEEEQNQNQEDTDDYVYNDNYEWGPLS